MAHLYLVPHDFSTVADAAFEHAFFLANPRKAAIKLLHIVSDKSKIVAAEEKLKAVVERFADKNVEGLEVSVLARAGSIFDDIGGIAEELKAQLIVMGTHGAKGMQKLFGSHAIKVVTSTSVPFLVVQETTPPSKINTVIVPIDTSKESLQIINVASYISALFDSKIYILAEKQSDPRLAQQLKVRISLVNKDFNEKKIDSEVVMLESSSPFQKKIRNFAKENGAELIAFAYHSDSLFPQFDGYAQSLITNKEEIPCLVINSKLLSKLYY